MYKIAFSLAFLLLPCTTWAQIDINPVSPEKLQAQIGQYITELFEDSQGNLWIGTLSKGVARYDGKSLRYFTKADGLIDNAVVSIVEDADGTLWFGTQAGLSHYDGRSFSNYTVEDGLCHFRVSNLLIDPHDNLWIATWGGVSQYDGSRFCTIPIPVPALELLSYQATAEWVTELTADPSGNIWFGRDGYGACKFDGENFTHFTEREGLPSNNVQVIAAGADGDIWIGSRVAERDHPDAQKRVGEGGLSRLNGKGITQFPDLPGLSQSDVYAIFQDRAEHIWIGTTGEGVYRYDGSAFVNFNTDVHAGPGKWEGRFKGIQQIFEDRNGTMWFGCAGGLFRLEGDTVVNVTQAGPWP